MEAVICDLALGRVVEHESLPGILLVGLTRGHVAMVEADCFERDCTYNRRDGRSASFRPSSLRWSSAPNRNFYYATASLINDGMKWILPLHRLITSCPAVELIDHRNGDTMDNRLDNLRRCTHAENARNHRPYKNATSQFIGVSVNKGRKPWRAQIHIRVDGKPVTKLVGTFYEQEDAALAYDRAALEFFGEFARLNFDSTQHAGATP